MMTKLKQTLFALFFLFLLGTSSCKKDYDVPIILSPEAQLKEELFEISREILRIYSTEGVKFMIETPAISSREVVIIGNNEDLIELENGGRSVSNDNANIEGLWSTMYKVITLSDSALIKVYNDDNIDFVTQKHIAGFASLFKGLSYYALAQSFERCPIDIDDSRFRIGAIAYNLAYSSLIRAEFLNTQANSDFVQEVIPGNSIDFINTSLFYQAKCLFKRGITNSHDINEVLEILQEVDVSSVSYFEYSPDQPNPVWELVNEGHFRPRDHFGLPENLRPEPSDGRLGFHLSPVTSLNSNLLPYDNLVTPFFLSETSSIPLYRPGEVHLLLAEVYARGYEASAINSGIGRVPDLPAALEAINMVRTKTNDPLGINANLPPYSGPVTQEALLEEIYRQRRIELFLSGESLADSRRFQRPRPSGNPRMFEEERNLNYYPYPLSEIRRNPNAPADPGF